MGRAQAIYKAAWADFLIEAKWVLSYGQYRVMSPIQKDGFRTLISVEKSSDDAFDAIVQAAHLDALNTVKDYLL